MQQLSGPLQEQKVFFGWFWTFLGNWGLFSGQGATLWSVTSLLSPKYPKYEHLMEIEWLITAGPAVSTDAAAVGSPARPEKIFGIF